MIPACRPVAVVVAIIMCPLLVGINADIAQTAQSRVSDSIAALRASASVHALDAVCWSARPRGRRSADQHNHVGVRRLAVRVHARNAHTRNCATRRSKAVGGRRGISGSHAPAGLAPVDLAGAAQRPIPSEPPAATGTAPEGSLGSTYGSGSPGGAADPPTEGSLGASQPGGGSSAPETAPQPFRFFSSTSFWNEPLSANAPLDPSSSAIVGALNKEVVEEEEAKKGPAINTSIWSVPIYTVPATQPLVTVALERASRTPALQAAWDAVPLPANAQPAAGTDKHLVVWQPGTDKLWEFWRLEHTAAGWGAPWGGAIQNVSSDSGAYGPEAWPGAATGWGASGTSLSIAGGLITLEDFQQGKINHALAIAAPNTRAGVYAAPAQRTDGSHIETSSLPEGAHLRLEPSLDLASLHLPRITMMLAEAAQRYGIFVRDTSGNVAFYAQDPTPTGSDPYTGAQGYFEGKCAQILAAFPWSHLQLLKMELHSAS
jgi:hypothetical protein